MLLEVEALSLIYVIHGTIKYGSTKVIFKLNSHNTVEDNGCKSWHDLIGSETKFMHFLIHLLSKFGESHRNQMMEHLEYLDTKD